jgi:anti-anti-sigma factor
MERTGKTAIARVKVKLLDDKELKVLARMIDECCGDSDAEAIVVDLSRVQLLPSVALGALVQLANKWKARNKRFTLAGVTPTIRQVFAITKLDRILELADSVEAATE